MGSSVSYNNQVWLVTVSNPNNPQITIFRQPNQTFHLDWRIAPYKIIRNNTARDHDLRENDLSTGVNAYQGLSSFERALKIRRRFTEAREQALVMIKDAVDPQINAASQESLDSLGLMDFITVRRGAALIGPGKNEEPAEWECTWIEGNVANPRRTWTFIIDSDNPEDTSPQEPHVGWTVSAAQGTQGAVANMTGHVWLDFVPVKRV